MKESAIDIPNSVKDGLQTSTEKINGYSWNFTKIENSATIKRTLRLAPSGAVTIPSELGGLSVTSIGEKSFCKCKSLTSITIPNSVTTIGNYAFSNCKSLKRISLPASITTIGDGAFAGCSSLTSISIPKSVTSIGEDAFWGCKSLQSVRVENQNHSGIY